MGKAMKASRIVEVGCGPGLGALIFTQNLMKSGAAYFVSDLSDEMV